MQEGERKNKSLLGWIKDNCEQMSQEPWQPSHLIRPKIPKERLFCSTIATLAPYIPPLKVVRAGRGFPPPFRAHRWDALKPK